MTISAERAQPLSSPLARERQGAIDEAVARTEAEHIDTAKYKYVNVDTRKVARIASPPPTNPNQALAPQQLMRSVKEAQTDSLMIFAIRVTAPWFQDTGNTMMCIAVRTKLYAEGIGC